MNSTSDSAPIRTVHVTEWRPQGVMRCLDASPRNFNRLMEDGRSVLKYPTIKIQNAMEALYEEADRFEVLGSHENLVVFKGIHPDGLLFEYCERGHLESLIRTQPAISEVNKARIGKQIVRGLMHLHGRIFLHCDLNVCNIFITLTLTAKVGYIQGQLYRTHGSIEMPTMSQENAKSRHPHAGEDEFSARTDIFALGTLLYYSWHGHPPFPELDEYREEEKIQARYRSDEFPIHAHLAEDMDKVISNCWRSEYEQADDILKDMVDLHPDVPDDNLMSSLWALLYRVTALWHLLSG